MMVLDTRPRPTSTELLEERRALERRLADVAADDVDCQRLGARIEALRLGGARDVDAGRPASRDHCPACTRCWGHSVSRCPYCGYELRA